MAPPDPAEPVLAKQSPEVRALTQQLRALIGEVLPQAKERVNAGWGALAYGTCDKMRDMLVGLLPQRIT